MQARLLAEKVGAPLYMASDIDPSEQEIEALKVPAAAGSYPFPAVELIENGGISPYIWRDGRYGIGLLMRGEGIITSRAFHTPTPLFLMQSFERIGNVVSRHVGFLFFGHEHCNS